MKCFAISKKCIIFASEINNQQTQTTMAQTMNTIEVINKLNTLESYITNVLEASVKHMLSLIAELPKEHKKEILDQYHRICNEFEDLTLTIFHTQRDIASK